MEINRSTTSHRSQATTRSQPRRPGPRPQADTSRQDVIRRSEPDTGSTSATARAATRMVRGLGEAFGRPRHEGTAEAAGGAVGRAAGEVGRRAGEAHDMTARLTSSLWGGSYRTMDGERHHHPKNLASYVPQGRIAMDESWRRTALGPIIGADGRVDVSRLNADMFRQLTPEQRRVFMQEMGRHEMPVSQSTPGGLTSAPNNVNGAEAVRNMMWASGDSTAFAQAWAAAPGSTRNLGQYQPPTISELTGPSRGVTDLDRERREQTAMAPEMARVLAENMGTVMQEMSANGGGYERPELEQAGRVVQRYMETHAGEDPQRAQECVRTMLESLDGSGLQQTPRNVGTATGVILGGMQHHFARIHEDDEARKNALTAALGGAGALAGALGPFGALVGAGLSVAGSMAGTSMESRNYQSLALQQRADAKLRWENESTRPAGWTETDALVASAALQTAVDANGLP